MRSLGVIQRSQAPGQTFGIGEPAPDEDCLVLNVWTPAVNDGRKRPVMFYCHGGGFWAGSGASVLQDASRLSRENDVVVVQSNHRLGIMGYLFLADVLGEPYASSANAGLLDIVSALGWTSRNIEAFGGDPSNVMVWGESGGGAKTSCIYAMPRRRALLSQSFHRERSRRAYDRQRNGQPHDPVGVGSAWAWSEAGAQASGGSGFQAARRPTESTSRWIAGLVRRSEGNRCIGLRRLQSGRRWASTAYASRSIRPRRRYRQTSR